MILTFNKIMNTLIVFASLHGCTKKFANKVSENLDGNITLVNLKESCTVNLDCFSTIIIGGSIHAGYINPCIQLFCERNLDILLAKNIGLFLCFMDSEEKFNYYLNKSFPPELTKIASAKEYFGGELDFEKLTFFEKLFIERTTKIKKSVSKINYDSISKFCNIMNVFVTAN